MTDEATKNGGSRPVPDPTVLTTEALMREVGAVQDKLGAQKELLQQSDSTEAQLRVKDIGAIQRELVLLDKQRIESRKADADALAAALSAAKEAVAQNNANFEKAITKTENATNELIKGLQQNFQTAISSVDGTINDLKERVNKLEQLVASYIAAQGGQEKGGDRQQKAESDKTAWAFAAIAAAVAVVSIIIQLGH